MYFLMVVVELQVLNFLVNFLIMIFLKHTDST